MWPTNTVIWMIWAIVFALLLGCPESESATAASQPAANSSSAHLRVEARMNDENSNEDEDMIATSYVLPNQIFNNGKPYYAGKDPISGQLDFSAKKPAGIETSANEVIDKREKIVLSSSAPNIHDFLNLPVKYSSSKFVYPLVSSSYANLKYQGNNKNYATNKKPTSEAASVTPAPSHNPHYSISTTKLMAVPTTAESAPPTQSTGAPTTSTATTTTTTTTTSSTSSSSTRITLPKRPATTLVPPTPSTSATTNPASRPPLRPSFPIRHTTSTRKPIPLTESSAVPAHTTVPTTRKKFIPTKKYTPTASTPASSTSSSATPTPTATLSVRFPQANKTTTVESTKPTPATNATTIPHKPPPTKPVETKGSVPLQFPKDQKSNATANISNFEAADIYQTLGQKNTELEQQKPVQSNKSPPMTLADLFNSLADEESAVASHNQDFSQGLDEQGNLVQPIAPSRPSPFAMQGQTSVSKRPYTPRPSSYTTTTTPLQHQSPSIEQQYQPSANAHFGSHPMSVGSGSQENEYVSYQVQQPNVMQYRPAPGVINNVVISHGQNSASFVLGSQQQVGTSPFGTGPKEPIFGAQAPVQYGTVISENIGDLKRPSPTGPGNGAYMKPPTSANPNANGHQNGNYAHAGASAPQTEPPAPPSPYQQLPLVNSSPRPKITVAPAAAHQQNSAGVTTPTALPQRGTTQTPVQPLRKPNGPPTHSNEQVVTTNFRFPTGESVPEELPTGLVSAGPPASLQVNGHAQPLSLQQIQHSSAVVFPKTSSEENTIGAQANDVQIQQHDVLLMTQQKQKLSFPAQHSSGNGAPSQHMEPPPRFQSEFTSSGTPINDQPSEGNHNRQKPFRAQGPPVYKPYNEHNRKHGLNDVGRPNSDFKLPNILPQFRPNAKISSGHPPSAYNQEPGNIRIPSPQLVQRPDNPSPQFAHRRQPMPMHKRYQTPYHHQSVGPAPPPQEAMNNRRVYHLPPYGGQSVQYPDRPYLRRSPLPNMVRPTESYLTERHGPTNDRTTSLHKPTGISPDRLAALEEEDLVINDPPQSMTTHKDPKAMGEVKLEPVVTLQMLQSQKKVLTTTNDNIGAGEIQVPPIASGNNDNNLSADTETAATSSQNGLYVVYPMHNGESHGRDPSLPAVVQMESTPSGSEYQNTPFSVVRDQPQEPILMAKNKKPQSLQQQQQHHQQYKPAAVRDKFPYPIEKPDFADAQLQTGALDESGVVIASRIINGAFDSETEATGPIAIAYTPTEPSAYSTRNGPKYSSVNLATSVIGEIRKPELEDASLNNDFDLRGQNYEKDFMAPFYPSISLGGAPKRPSSGWNVLPSAPSSSYDNDQSSSYAKNQIDRADITANGGADQSVTETEFQSTINAFEADKFQPELQGGFKPIYPPGYTLDNDTDTIYQTTEKEPNSNSLEQFEEAPMALASVMEAPTAQEVRSNKTTLPTAAATTTTTTTTTKRPDGSSTPSTTSSKTTEHPEHLAKHTKPTQSSLSTSPPSNTQVPPKTEKKKSIFESSLEALLFGSDDDDKDNEDVDEARLRKTVNTIDHTPAEPMPTAAALVSTNLGAVSPPNMKLVPRMGPRSLNVR